MGHYRSKEDACLAFDRAAIALRTFAKATKQGLNYPKDIYKEEWKILEVSLRAHIFFHEIPPKPAKQRD